MKQRKTEEILELLKMLYKLEGGDQRFFQFLHNIQRDYENKDPRAKKVTNDLASGFDFFYVEDDDFLKYLRKRLETDQTFYYRGVR